MEFFGQFVLCADLPLLFLIMADRFCSPPPIGGVRYSCNADIEVQLISRILYPATMALFNLACVNFHLIGRLYLYLYPLFVP